MNRSSQAQFDRLLDYTAEKLPAVAEHLENARADVLAFTGFPKDVWTQIWSNNSAERAIRTAVTAGVLCFAWWHSVRSSGFPISRTRLKRDW